MRTHKGKNDEIESGPAHRFIRRIVYPNENSVDLLTATRQ